jgi:hypothetical protein
MGEEFEFALYEKFGMKTVTGHYGPRRQMAPAGLLRLTAGHWNKIEEKQSGIALEERLNEFIARLVKQAIDTKASRVAAEARRREWLKQEAVRQRSEQEAKTHKLKIDHVKRLAAVWEEQIRFRAFLEAVEQQLPTVPAESFAEARQRVEWIRETLEQQDAPRQLLLGEWPVASLRASAQER